MQHPPTAPTNDAKTKAAIVPPGKMRQASKSFAILGAGCRGHVTKTNTMPARIELPAVANLAIVDPARIRLNSPGARIAATAQPIAGCAGGGEKLSPEPCSFVSDIARRIYSERRPTATAKPGFKA
jgi:hypothetical protein